MHPLPEAMVIMRRRWQHGSQTFVITLAAARPSSNMPKAVLGSSVLPSSNAGPERSTHLQELGSDSGAQHREAVDSLRFLAGGRLASKSLDGRMLVWDTAQRLQLASWKASSASCWQASLLSHYC